MIADEEFKRKWIEKNKVAVTEKERKELKGKKCTEKDRGQIQCVAQQQSLVELMKFIDG